MEFFISENFTGRTKVCIRHSTFSSESHLVRQMASGQTPMLVGADLLQLMSRFLSLPEVRQMQYERGTSGVLKILSVQTGCQTVNI